MTMIVVQTNSVTVGAEEFPKNTLTFRLHRGTAGHVSIHRLNGDVVIQHQPYNQYVNSTGQPYATLADLITALRTAFFA